MFSRKSLSLAAFAGTIAVSLWAYIPAASSGSPSVEEEVWYEPIQSISYDFGSKSTSGYFAQQDGACFVVLMISEKSDPEALLPLSPTRARLTLYPGQTAGLDSEEGRSLNLTCGENASSLLVSAGDRDKLVRLQKAMQVQTAAGPD
jgi:hypothetical protein